MRDYAILSAGGARYTTNSRYSVHMSPAAGLWTLQIRNDSHVSQYLTPQYLYILILSQ